MTVWAQAGMWGLFAGGALVVGAAVAWVLEVPRSLVAAVMAFGAGVLISALAFDLFDQAETQGGLRATVIGFLGGAVVYVAANVVLVPEPVGPVTSTSPRGRSASLAMTGGSPNS